MRTELKVGDSARRSRAPLLRMSSLHSAQLDILVLLVGALLARAYRLLRRWLRLLMTKPKPPRLLATPAISTSTQGKLP